MQLCGLVKKRKKKKNLIFRILVCAYLTSGKLNHIISCFRVGYREISVKIFFDLTLVTPVKIPILMFLLPAHASQPDRNMTSFILHFSRLT